LVKYCGMCFLTGSSLGERLLIADVTVIHSERKRSFGMLEALNMTMLDIAWAGVTICLAVAAQSAVGFGSALFAAPVLVLIGIPLPNVIAMVATCSMLQATVGAYKLRKSIPWSIGVRRIGRGRTTGSSRASMSYAQGSGGFGCMA